MDTGLYVIIAGAGKVGWNLARELLDCVFYALRDGRVRRLRHTGAA